MVIFFQTLSVLTIDTKVQIFVNMLLWFGVIMSYFLVHSDKVLGVFKKGLILLFKIDYNDELEEQEFNGVSGINFRNNDSTFRD